jgi:hypothetical protein
MSHVAYATYVTLYTHSRSSKAPGATLQQVLKTFFGGSLRLMTSALVSEESWSDEDLEALRGEFDRVRKGRK